LSFLKSIGFMQCDGTVKVFDTWQEAENAPDVYKIVVR
jgi:hypothetical protein